MWEHVFMTTTPRPRQRKVSIHPGDRAALEERRRAAADLFRRGATRAEVSRALGVSRQSAGRWYEQWQRGGLRALRSAARVGRPPWTSEEDLRRVEGELLRGACAHGFPTDLWTLPRVALVIERTVGVRYHPGHVWRLLRRMGWSLQRPARRARERDEAGIQRWVHEEWPRIKKR